MPRSLAPADVSRRIAPMDRITGRIVVTFGFLMPALFGVLHADPPRSAARRNATADPAEKSAARPNVLIIGASSLNSPVAQTQLVGAMLSSEGIQMNVAGKYPQLDAVNEMLDSEKEWDYVVMDAWHLGRGRVEQDPFRASVPAN